MHCDARWTTTAITAEIVRGAVELERTERGVLPHRLPAWARAQWSDGQLAMAEAQPAGVRLVFATAATTIELDTYPTRLGYAGAPRRPAGVYDLHIDGRRTARAVAPGGDTVTIDMATGSTTRQTGPVGTVRFADLPAGNKKVEIWLPHNEITELAVLRTDAAVAPVPGDGRRVWLQYGSSISQGSDAAGPSTTWPALAAARGEAELINLGLSGSAMLDPFAARLIRDTRADLIGLEIGINLVNADVMRMRAFGPAVHGFLSTIREGHPTTPLLVISPIYCEIHENTPGPGAFDLEALSAGEMRFVATGDPAEQAKGKLTLGSIRDELSRIVARRAAQDPNLCYLDGRELYGETDYAERPLPDRLHPDAVTHELIGARFAERVFTADGVFGNRREGARPAVAARG